MTKTLLKIALVLFVVAIAAPLTCGRAEAQETRGRQENFPQTIVAVTTVTNGEGVDRATAIACTFAAEGIRNLGFAVASYCPGSDVAAANTVVPRGGDPVLLVVFSHEEVISRSAFSGATPPQASGASAGVFTILSTPLEGYDSLPFGPHLNFPVGDWGPGHTARTVTLCMGASGTEGADFEELVDCLSRSNLEETGVRTLTVGYWNPLDAPKVLYPPRAPPSDRVAAAMVRSVTRYRLQDERKTSPAKVALMGGGGALAAGGAIAWTANYMGARALVEDVNAGVYGYEGDPRLVEAREAYRNARTRSMAFAAMVATGVSTTAVGIALPTADENSLSVAMSPWGLVVTKRF